MREDVKDFRVVVSVDIFDDAKDAAFDVDGSQITVEDASVDDIVADDALAWDHSSRCFSARRGIGAGEVRDSLIWSMDAHEEHMFGEPSFAVSASDGKSEGKFFESDRITGVLVIDGEDAVIFQIDVDSALIDIF